ncbi:hypothetical protein [uncultured Anaerovibrio sp.]|uniref:hypothetical protein n=1 Tax=uncultured Anaerovibrio sp. TaxID=361586 RepID=UPI00261BC998|nr:hypothetical protein [uncultured Anaerovibrio sp.]
MSGEINNVDVENLPVEFYAHDLAIAYIMRTSELDQNSTPEQFVEIYNRVWGKFANQISMKR